MRPLRAASRTARRVYGNTVDRIRQRGRSALLRALRLTGTALASYLAALALHTSDQPLLAPLTALIVVQVTLFSTLTSGLQRVASVTAGVLLAVGFSSLVGLTWWSLGILVAVSILVGQLLRLGPHLIEVPISAMLVLAVGGGRGCRNRPHRRDPAGCGRGCRRQHPVPTGCPGRYRR